MPRNTVRMAPMFLPISDAPDPKGVLVLLNCDRITCEVKELLLGRLRHSSDDLGTTQIERDKIASVDANPKKNDLRAMATLGWKL